MPESTKSGATWVVLVVFTLSKFVFNTSFRWVYPFIPFIAEDLDLSVDETSRAISIGELSGLGGPLAGPVAAKLGIKSTMIIGMVFLSLGNVIIAFGTFSEKGNFESLASGRFVLGIGLFFAAPLIQAYIGFVVSLEKRSRVTGIVETSWALAVLAGTPLMGLIFEGSDAGFSHFVLAGCILLSAVLVQILLPSIRSKIHGEKGKINSDNIASPDRTNDVDADDDATLSKSAAVDIIDVGGDKEAIDENYVHGSENSVEQNASCSASSFVSNLLRILKKREAHACLMFAASINLSANLIFSTFGRWLKDVHSRDIGQVGSITTGLGACELLGALATTLLADKLGARHLILLSMILKSIAFLVLAFIQGTLPAGLAAIYIAFGAFETALTTSLSLASSIVEPREIFMPFFLAAFSVGRYIGVVIGSPLWDHSGFKGISIAASAVAAFSLVPLIFMKSDETRSIGIANEKKQTVPSLPSSFQENWHPRRPRFSEGDFFCGSVSSSLEYTSENSDCEEYSDY